MEIQFFRFGTGMWDDTHYTHNMSTHWPLTVISNQQVTYQA